MHCADPTNDGLLYLCDRQNNRVQFFRLDGTYVREAYYAPATLGGWYASGHLVWNRRGW